ncbi:MAG: OmpA family protein [Burkholderiaceae bacterium]|nr:OmpA family protein [Burkholderiaceae bacterium]
MGFASGSAVLTARGRAVLDAVARCLRANRTAGRFEVGGHTDGEGNSGANLQLSVLRAQAAAAYLRARGVAPDRLEPRGYGESQPVARDDTPAGRAANRRISFRPLPR